jgi:ABC-type Zn uptake system ZnuABC Zn-binding protein ZnuA
MIEAGQPLDELEETPERRQKVRNANLLVTRGQFDSWTLEGTGNAYQDRRILRIDTLPASGEQDNTHFLWIDPRVALELANELSMRLTTLEPESGDYFSANARAFSQEVANLMEQSTIRIHHHGGGLFASLDRRFLPLARRFGLQEVALPPVSLTDPTPYGVKALRQATKEAGARAMFASARMPIALSQEWERRLSMPVLTLEPVGSSAGSGRDTYVAILKYNIDHLLEGIEMSAAPKPIELPVYADPPMEIANPTPEDQTRAEAEKVFNTRPVFKVPLPPTRPSTTRPFKPIPLDFERPSTSPLRPIPRDGKPR